MKFIKLFESYKLTGLDDTSVISAINSLRYIIEDECCTFLVDPIGIKGIDKYCSIYIWKNNVEDTKYEWYEIQQFSQSGPYLEFLDRLEEAINKSFYITTNLDQNSRYITISIIHKKFKK